MLSAEQLAAAIQCPLARAQKWFEPLNAAMAANDINTLGRIAAFLAQIGHESGALAYVREIWGPTPAQSRYEGRADLGNTESGDGIRFRGRGLIQVTGRHNYRRVSDALGRDFVRSPGELELPECAALSAAWFWKTHGCNELADAEAFEKITQRINGGMNGYIDRVARLKIARAMLSKGG